MDKSITLPELAGILNITPQSAGKAAKAVTSEIRGKTRHLLPESVRHLFEERGFHFPQKNIIFHCLKGGASKTTLAYNTSYRLSQLGARVLLVDLDKQANATRSFKVPRPEFVFVDAVVEKCNIEQTILPISTFLSIIPSSLENARLEMELINRKKNPKTFYKNLFEPIRTSYDFVILDLPPDLNHNTYLSSLFADIICIPTNPDDYSVSGMKMTLASLDGIAKEYGDLQQDIYIVWSKYDARERNSFHYITEFREPGRAQVMPIVIRADATFKNAQSELQSVFEFKRKSNAAEDIDILAQELSGLREFFGPKGTA